MSWGYLNISDTGFDVLTCFIISSNEYHPAKRLKLQLSIKVFITKTCLYNIDPLKTLFYVVKPGFTGVYIIFLNTAQKHRV